MLVSVAAVLNTAEMERRPLRTHHVPSVPLRVGAIASIVGLAFAAIDRSWWGIALPVAVLVVASAVYINADRQQFRS